MTDKYDDKVTSYTGLDLDLIMDNVCDGGDKKTGLCFGESQQLGCHINKSARSSIPTNGLALLSAAAADSTFDRNLNENDSLQNRKLNTSTQMANQHPSHYPATSRSNSGHNVSGSNHTINVPKYPQPRSSGKTYNHNTPSTSMMQVPNQLDKSFGARANASRKPYHQAQPLLYGSNHGQNSLHAEDLSKDNLYNPQFFGSHLQVPNSFMPSYQHASHDQFSLRGGQSNSSSVSLGRESAHGSSHAWESLHKDRARGADASLSLDIEVVDLQQVSDRDLNNVVSSLGFQNERMAGSCGTSPASSSSTPSPSSNTVIDADIDTRNYEGERLQKISKSSGVFRTKYFPDGTNLKLAEKSLHRVLPELKHKPTASATVSSASHEADVKPIIGSFDNQDDVQIVDSSTANQSEQIMRKEVYCQVCGDVAAGFYCGAYICEACKKFFVRASRQEKIKYVCHKSESCVITKETRVRCQFCRYQKCLKLNMYSPGDIQGKEAGGSIANIPCRVCGGASSGFHFGALTCEGCKGFFRRMAKEREWNTYKCSKENACEISMLTRNVCKSCRYRKCLEAGMSVEASRIGRQPNAVKHAISVEARKQGTRVAEGKPAQNDQFSLDFAAFALAHTKAPPAVIKQELDMEIVDETIRSVKDAWKELSALYAHEKISFDSHNLSIKDCQNTWRMLMVHFEFNAKCIIKFSKKLPKFQFLCIEDQVSLIQMATYSLCILNHSQFYDVEKKAYRFFDFTKEEEEAILKYFPQFSIITNHFHHFGTLLKKPEFDETELAFLSSLVLLNTDNLTLKNKEGADKLHAELMESLQIYIERNHTDHEKRMGYLLLRISELALASLQHNQCVGAVAKANPELENQLWEEMYLK